MTFKAQKLGNTVFWTGDPDCASGYAELEKHLARAPRPKLPSTIAFGNTHLGNLGEALAFVVGRISPHGAANHRVMADNCSNPLAGNSKTGLDILWLAFDPINESNDHAWIQEVKTTGSKSSATYISDLKADYKKLFDGSIGLSLEERLGDAAFKLEFSALEPKLAQRTRALGARSAADVKRVTLAPTGVHDRAVSAGSVIEDVRNTLVSNLGWSSSLVEPHLIALSDLATSLEQLVR